jgi:hypothetical protein
MRSVNRIYLALLVALGLLFIYFTFLEIELKKEFDLTIEYQIEDDAEEFDYACENGIFSFVAFTLNQNTDIHFQSRECCNLSNMDFTRNFADSQVKWQKYSGLPPPKFSTLSYL